MYLFDTNVISEMRKISTGRADENVTKSLAQIPEQSVFVSVITIFAIELGILKAAKDKPKALALRQWMDETVLPTLEGRILPITSDVALRCARLHMPDPYSERDAWIAATSLVHGLTLVTRNVRV